MGLKVNATTAFKVDIFYISKSLIKGQKNIDTDKVFIFQTSTNSRKNLKNHSIQKKEGQILAPLGPFHMLPLDTKMHSYCMLKRTGRYHNGLLGINCFNSLG
ncbi:hypothetical protein EUGRSUZ_I01057 [Eucalyptus grandis]|uniref:Uncharacterized protein n=2 Tax=Eucalyptus grandis TaxID=71139 RepID=A0ACC3JDS2_EUCGR|nr:hypothetical protein EUGRSUZ_I01057 [Eucalyptus grandis]